MYVPLMICFTINCQTSYCDILFLLFSVMGHVINNGLELMSTGHSPRLDPEFEKSLGLMSHLVADTNKLSEWERQHVRAINLYGKGYWLFVISQ